MSHMDRDEALELLLGGTDGVKKWNKRRVAGEEIPKLSDADLSHAVLSGANLREVNLEKADLSGATLWGIDLVKANLRSASQPRPCEAHPRCPCWM